ncbi:uncharacterized protein LOC129581001 isoform X2 [Paramacrobiotus metropolitanus]|nr:uncharacterized protein LOC129581001 isoform X2 [Paramacrobiotus metropolitanus]XP_055327787.1 uncharacterized protein LOC129581001 isoform X2 [Paramacrobiotus metropolitanus]XP_055327788.1 uncharacterized protein LOC129581001 isoform X2 [Paramacrobiotus metropolitanus]XP_055327789.1 uncharacterized protein LOC129581001 isoform X2 [Paramacrobiotus metropolitanus]XP_055327790.1 uncharacterized protein LOC129581001 isoform X2 [Paramacrobiotus metropolitanus]
MPFGRKTDNPAVKRSSYYVCFIGAKESSVIRDHNNGHEFVYPAMHYLLRSLMENGPLANAPKITLQVSAKGLKIIQNVSRQALTPSRTGLTQGNNNNVKTDTLRHSIPHHCITCAYQGEPPYDDLVATILLIFNPATHCPVHIHVYRCDSSKTATLLTHQLAVMAERPENQTRFAAIEERLRGRGLLHPISLQQSTPGGEYRNGTPNSRGGGAAVLSDGQSSGRTSSSPETSETGKGKRPLSLTSSTENKDHIIPLDKVAQNADKLAMELKERLKTRDTNPILLPPKDYDTVNRGRGKTGIKVTAAEEGSESEAAKPAESSVAKNSIEGAEDDDEWNIHEEEEDDVVSREHPVITKADLGTNGFQERMKRYCSMNDVFGESVNNGAYMAPKIPDVGSPAAAAAAPTGSDASAAYRPRPYYFSTVEENEKGKVKTSSKTALVAEFRNKPVQEITEGDITASLRESQMIVQSYVRPSMPLKRNQRPVVNERIRPASFYERIRFDDQDFQEGRFVRPELIYYQYRC